MKPEAEIEKGLMRWRPDGAFAPANGADREALRPYAGLTDNQLRNRLDPDRGIMVVESPKVIRTALEAGMKPLSLLCEERHLRGDAAPLLGRLGDAPVYTGSRETLRGLTGYTLTRGVLCAMRRPALPTPEETTRGARRVGVLAGVCDTTNVGAIFRSAAALGLDALLLTADSCDPLNRRSIRVSMGTVFQIPWAWIESTRTLRELGFKTAAMALRGDSVNIDCPALHREERLAVILGTEGDGLPPEVVAEADWTVCIPMANGVDSLNVGNAAAIAFWELTRRRT